MLDTMKIFKVRFVRALPEDYYDFDKDIDMCFEDVYDDPMVEIVRDGKRVLIEYDYTTDAVKTAIRYIKNKLGFTPIGLDSDKDYYYIAAK